MKNLVLKPISMSSLEIAGLTGKRHDHVIRDIEKMFSDCEFRAPKFGGSYKTAQNKTQKCYNLNKTWTLT